MKKLYALSLLAVGLSIPAFAADKVPTDTTGGATNPIYAGASTCDITNSTSTRAVLCTSGSGIILDIVGSSVAAADQLVFRDSATANTSSTVLYTVDLTALGKVSKVFPSFVNGLSINALVAPTAAGGTSRPAWTIVYRKVAN